MLLCHSSNKMDLLKVFFLSVFKILEFKLSRIELFCLKFYSANMFENLLYTSEQ